MNKLTYTDENFIKRKRNENMSKIEKLDLHFKNNDDEIKTNEEILETYKIIRENLRNYIGEINPKLHPGMAYFSNNTFCGKIVPETPLTKLGITYLIKEAFERSILLNEIQDELSKEKEENLEFQRIIQKFSNRINDLKIELSNEKSHRKNQVQFWRDRAIKEQEKNSKALEKITLLIDIGFDYDGFNNVDNLKTLIDELVSFARDTRDILGGKDDNN